MRLMFASFGALRLDLPSLTVFKLRRGTRIRNSKQNKNKTEKNKTLNNLVRDDSLHQLFFNTKTCSDFRNLTYIYSLDWKISLKNAFNSILCCTITSVKTS